MSHPCIHSHTTCTYIHTYIHIDIHTYIHAHTHTCYHRVFPIITLSIIDMKNTAPLAIIEGIYGGGSGGDGGSGGGDDGGGDVVAVAEAVVVVMWCHDTTHYMRSKASVLCAV